MLGKVNKSNSTFGWKHALAAFLFVFLISVTPPAVEWTMEFFDAIGQILRGETGTESVVAGAVSSINEDAPTQIGDALLVQGAEARSDKEIQINWKLLSFAKEELDLELAREAVDGLIMETLSNGSGIQMRAIELFRQHSIVVIYSITDMNDDHLFDVVLGPDDY
jgi:hypothetical protein